MRAARLRRWLRHPITCAAAILLVPVVVAVIAVLVVPLPARLGEADAVVVTYEDDSPAYVFLSEDERWRIATRPEDIDSQYLEALLAFEDQRFWFHLGVDPIAVLRALAQNIEAGRVVSGASTLTMQVVRILEPRPRTFRSKAIEALRAVQLEARMSKEAILSAYLRFAPFGKNIEGVRAASFAYFGHDASALSPAEIAYLVAVPQDPNARYPTSENRRDVRIAVDHVAEELLGAGVFSDAQLRQAKKDELPVGLREFPRAARHAAIWVQQGRAGEQSIRTTLKRGVQGRAERIMGAYHEHLRALGVHNGSLVVIDNATGHVEALVGNFDYWDDEHHGQVVGFLGPRSPGSTLKPFIYAMAIDRGLLLPSYLIEDVPVRFGSYEPKNYDERFRGLISAEAALAHSLNIPAVVQLKAIDVQTFLSFLESHGVTTLGERERYGLSAAIGGIDLNLLELTNLFATLARGGAYQPWTVDPNEPAHQGEPHRVISDGAAFLTRQALSLRDRPDFPSRRKAVQLAGNYFWKTGTSYGHRDAWAIGSNGVHTVGVWLGNFDGSPAKPLVGGERAGPILFDVLDALSNRSFAEARVDRVPDDLIEIEVCALSGRLPSPHCPDRHKQRALLRNLPTEHCSMHVAIDVDRETGHALCPVCRGGRDYETRVFTVLPTSVRRWVADRTLLAQRPPSHLPSCPHVQDGVALEITQPQANTTVFVIPGLDATEQEIPLEVAGAGRAGVVYWFVNGELLARAAPDERVWLAPEVGKHEIRVVDAAGRGDRVEIEIRTF